MKISIAQRMRPFSHELGTTCLLPRTCLAVQAFPTLIRIYSKERIIRTEPLEIPLPFTGPVREFTVQQDLEVGCVWIWGIAKEGRFRLRLQATQTAIELWQGKECQTWSYAGPFVETPLRERLSLGSHRAQDWELVKRRLDLREILPALFLLSQWIPSIPPGPETELFHLLHRELEPALRAGLYGILAPRLIDEEFQGILPSEKIGDKASPCAFILEAGKEIRRQFIEQQGELISLKFPREFDCGRMTDLRCEGIGTLDVEWSKRRVQRAIVRGAVQTTVRFELPSPLVSYRLRTSCKERGRRIEKRAEWECHPGVTYLLDQFQK